MQKQLKNLKLIIRREQSLTSSNWYTVPPVSLQGAHDLSPMKKISLPFSPSFRRSQSKYEVNKVSFPPCCSFRCCCCTLLPYQVVTMVMKRLTCSASAKHIHHLWHLLRGDVASFHGGGGAFWIGYVTKMQF